jgi:hypothetical protein
MTPTSADAPSRGGLRQLALAFAVVLGTGACTAAAPDQSGRWGSDQASLTLADSGGSLYVLASGGCYGSYGDFDQSLPEGGFSVPGTYTQLTGAYPGMIRYPALFSGTIEARQLSITVTVPALQGAIGPFTLTRGVTRAWPACLYP